MPRILDTLLRGRRVVTTDPRTVYSAGPVTRNALVLSGGGARGDFQVGAVRFLYGRNWFPEIILGTSVGAINGAKLAELKSGGHRGPDYIASLEELENMWYGLQTNGHMWDERTWVKQLAGIVPSGVTGHSADFRHSLRYLSINPLVAFGFGLLYAGQYAAALLKGMDSDSIYSLNPIAATMRGSKGLDLAFLGRSVVDFRCATVSLETGETSYVDGRGRWSGSMAGQPDVADVYDAILASASFPIAFQPVTLAGQHFVDGGIREILPVQEAVRAGGSDIVGIVASASPQALSQPPADALSPGVPPHWRLLDIFNRSVTELLTDEVIRNEMQFAAAGAKVQLIQPTLNIHDILTIDPGLISIQMDYGFMRAYDAIQPMSQNDRAIMRQTSDDITAQRFANWQLEHEVFGHPPPDSDYPPTRDELFRARAQMAGPVEDIVARDYTRRLAPGAYKPGRPLNDNVTPWTPSESVKQTPVPNNLAVDKLIAGKKRVAALVTLRLREASNRNLPTVDALPPVRGTPQLAPPPQGAVLAPVDWSTKWERHPWTDANGIANPADLEGQAGGLTPP